MPNTLGMSSEEETFLNDIWTLYFHDPYDANWNTSSYQCLGNIGSVEEFWKHHSMLKPHLHKGMFFLMRDGIFPSWDATANINGGCMSIKVLKEHLADFWEDLLIKTLGETLLKEPHREKAWDCVNGLSTSPKKTFCIVKIWLKEKTITSKEFFSILPKYHGDIIFKSNIENITHENMTRSGRPA